MTQENEESKLSQELESPEATPLEAEGSAAAKPKKKSRKPVVASVVAVIVVAAVAGGLAWHEQPSFCNAICHVSMDAYLPTYEAQPGKAATDKWGNTVSNASSMLAATHREAGKTCLDCHVPTLSEQLTEGAEWVTGNYTVVSTANENSWALEERNASELTEARGIDGEKFCLNESCHNITKEELTKKTSNMTRNPHSWQHSQYTCTDCHKSHRASVMICSKCHSDATIPDGWVSAGDSQTLESNSTDQQ